MVSKRMEFLQNLVKTVLEGKFYHQKIDLNKVYPSPTQEVRKEYLNPVEWNGPNYGYKTMGEFNPEQKDS